MGLIRGEPLPSGQRGAVAPSQPLLLYSHILYLWSTWGTAEVFCILRSTWGSTFGEYAISVQRGTSIPTKSSYSGLCTEFLLNPTWGKWEEDLIIPPATWGLLYGGRPHASGNTAELSLLEFYLYTYNVGLDSIVGVIVGQ